MKSIFYLLFTYKMANYPKELTLKEVLSTLNAIYEEHGDMPIRADVWLYPNEDVFDGQEVR